MRKFLMVAAVLAVAACAEKAPEADVVDSVPVTQMTPSEVVDSAGKMIDSVGSIVDSAAAKMKMDTTHTM